MRPANGRPAGRRDVAAMTASFRTDPPFRAEHVGSLLRPDFLRQAYRDFSAGSAAGISTGASIAASILAWD